MAEPRNPPRTGRAPRAGVPVSRRLLEHPPGIPRSAGPPCPVSPLRTSTVAAPLRFVTDPRVTKTHPGAPQPAPDFRAYRLEQWDQVRWLLARHTRLVQQRALSALLLALVNLLAAAATIWVFAQCAQFIDPSLRLLRLAVLLVGMLAMIFQFAALLLALGAALWARVDGPAPAAGDLSLFFHSGDGAPAVLAILNNESEFRRAFGRANREQMLQAAQRELLRQARSRQRQERLFAPALISTAAGVLALFITALIAFIALI